VADLVRDRGILQLAVQAAQNLLEADPELDLPEHAALRTELKHEKNKTPWSKIS
jgi:hypothetical protein